MATTNSDVAGPLLPRMDSNPTTLGAVAVSQRWHQRDDSGLRCDNILKISRPDDSWSSAWTLLPAGGESSLILQHSAQLVSAESPLTIQISLDRIVLDGNRKAGDAPEEIVALPTPPLPAFVGDVGKFDVVLLDDRVQVTRAKASPFGGASALRIFARRDQPLDSTSEPAATVPRSRSGAPAMLAGRRPPPRTPARRGATPPPSTRAKGRGIDATLPSLIYYGAYTFFFGRLALAVLERFIT